MCYNVVLKMLQARKKEGGYDWNEVAKYPRGVSATAGRSSRSSKGKKRREREKKKEKMPREKPETQGGEIGRAHV